MKLKKKLYKERDIEFLDEMGGYYCQHIMAMTEEELHDKMDIAAELAYRDYKIDQMQMQLEEFLDGT
jgi:hypothetical protein